MTALLKSETQPDWLRVCHLEDLVENSGICALVDKLQIAIFSLKNKESVFAVSNFDPMGDANVIYRGIVGSRGEEPIVASPLFKHHYSLVSGLCLQDQSASLAVFPTRVNGGQVEVLV